MDRVVVGLDNSQHAEAALRWALDHSSRHGASISAVWPWPPDDSDVSRAVDERHAGERHSRAALDALLDRLGVDVHVVVDADSGQNLDIAATDADLVVIGAPRLRLGQDDREPSIAHVLRHASCPIAVVRAPSADLDAPIVVGVDGSAASMAALRWAVDDSFTSGRPLVAVHAWQLDAPSGGFVITDDDVARFDRVARAQLDAVLDDVVDRSVAVDARVEYGTPGAVLLDPDLDPALTVLGRRGLDSTARGQLGSVSELVASSASSVVVVVPEAGPRP
jgi:nucleotide-binding universal stress UspA family protein